MMLPQKLVFHLLIGCVFLAGCKPQKESPVTTLYNIEVETMTGDTVRLDAYAGKVMLIVNTASK